MPFLINGMCFIYSFQLLILLFLIKFYNSYPFFALVAELLRGAENAKMNNFAFAADPVWFHGVNGKQKNMPQRSLRLCGEWRCERLKIFSGS